MAYRFEAKVAARGYHIYRNVKPGNKVTVELETNDESKKIDPYCCATKAMVGQPPLLKPVGHIPREISRHVFYFLKEEIEVSLHSTQYRYSPIPAGGLEIPLMLTFKSARYITHEKMKEFVTSLYPYEFDPQEKSDTDDEDEIDFIINKIRTTRKKIVKW